MCLRTNCHCIFFNFQWSKEKYIETVATLANTCINVGAAAFLEIDNELASELQDIISMVLMNMGLPLNDLCPDAFHEATVTAINLLTLKHISRSEFSIASDRERLFVKL